MIEIEQIAKDIMEKFKDFTDGVRVMMLINRGIGNTNKGSKRWINKLISTNKDEFNENLTKLLNLQYYLNDSDIRLYTSVNPRKMYRAVKYFMHKQIDMNTDEEIMSFYKNINNNFCSALMKPENRNDNLFLVDYDNNSYDQSLAMKTILKDCGINLWHSYKTPNGYHFICDPFDPRLLSVIKDCEVKKDALILLHTLSKEKGW